jgi:hypothetical protein
LAGARDFGCCETGKTGLRLNSHFITPPPPPFPSHFSKVIYKKINPMPSVVFVFVSTLLVLTAAEQTAESVPHSDVVTLTDANLEHDTQIATGKGSLAASV